MPANDGMDDEHPPAHGHEPAGSRRAVRDASPGCASPGRGRVQARAQPVRAAVAARSAGHRNDPPRSAGSGIARLCLERNGVTRSGGTDRRGRAGRVPGPRQGACGRGKMGESRVKARAAHVGYLVWHGASSPCRGPIATGKMPVPRAASHQFPHMSRHGLQAIGSPGSSSRRRRTRDLAWRTPSGLRPAPWRPRTACAPRWRSARRLARSVPRTGPRAALGRRRSIARTELSRGRSNVGPSPMTCCWYPDVKPKPLCSERVRATGRAIRVWNRFDISAPAPRGLPIADRAGIEAKSRQLRRASVDAEPYITPPKIPPNFFRPSLFSPPSRLCQEGTSFFWPKSPRIA